jgi:hypothetical protein
MDVWSWLAFVVAVVVFVGLGPSVFLRRWSWRERFAALRERALRSRS